MTISQPSERATVEVHPIEVTVPLAGASTVLRGWIAAPAGVDPHPVLLFCLPGGNCTTGYFDLQTATGDDSYSMAVALAARGLLVCSLDHPGIGRSDPVGDLFTITMGVAAGAHAHAVAHLTRGLATGELVAALAPVRDLTVIGVGHSMGAGVISVIQSRHGCFDAVACLGFGGGGLPEVLTPAELEFARLGTGPDDERLVALARLRFRDRPAAARRPAAPLPGRFHAADVAEAATAAMATQTTTLLYSCGLASMLPGALSTDLARIDRPVFLAVGDQDLVTDLPAIAAAFTAAPDLSLFRLADAGHCHHTANGRAHLWDRLARWAATVVR